MVNISRRHQDFYKSCRDEDMQKLKLIQQPLSDLPTVIKILTDADFKRHYCIVTISQYIKVFGGNKLLHCLLFLGCSLNISNNLNNNSIGSSYTRSDCIQLV